MTAVERAPAPPSAALVDALRRFADQQRQVVSLSPGERVRLLLRFLTLAGYQLVQVEATEVRLTERQQELLELISHGHSNPEIGRLWFVAEETVKTHALRLYRQLGVQSRAHAVRRGFELGLLRVDSP